MKLYAKKVDDVWYKGTLVDIISTVSRFDNGQEVDIAVISALLSYVLFVQYLV